MPCYDSRNDSSRIVVDNPEDKKIISELMNRNKSLEAGLCAIITELEKEGIANKIITRASRSGLIDLVGFWANHSKEDDVRLAKKLHSEFSEHEQSILRKLLGDK